MALGRRGESGQAGAAAVVFISVLVLLLAVAFHLGEAILVKVQLANAIDAGAQAGGALLATALNAEAAINWLQHSAYIGWGKPVLYRKLQTYIAETAPKLAVGVAVETAMTNGADIAICLNPLVGCHLPDLEIRWQEFPVLGKWFPGVFPRYARDASTRSRRLPYGKRFVLLGGIKKRPEPAFLKPLLGKRARGGWVVAVSQSAVHGRGMVSPSFKASLVPVQLIVRRQAAEVLQRRKQPPRR